MKSTIHGIRSFDRSPTTLRKTFLVDWFDFSQQNCFNLTQIHSNQGRTTSTEHLAWRTTRAAFGPSR